MYLGEGLGAVMIDVRNSKTTPRLFGRAVSKVLKLRGIVNKS